MGGKGVFVHAVLPMAAATFLGVVIGAIGSWSASRKGRRGAPESQRIEEGRLHFIPHRDSPIVKALADAIWWFGPDFSPKPVPRFYDVASICENPAVFREVVNLFEQRYRAMPEHERPTAICGYDARGFILGAPIALALGVKFVLLRKDKKSPGVLVESSAFEKEYKEVHAEQMCLRVGSLAPADRVVLIDDLIATGGTAVAGIELVEAIGAAVVEFAAVTCLPGLGGSQFIHSAHRGRYARVPVYTLVEDEAIGDERCRDPRAWREAGRVVPVAQAERVRVLHGLSER
jgi:adenine phosphoribosyltransferase